MGVYRHIAQEDIDRDKKCHFLQFTNVIDVAVYNAHILYSMVNENISILDFRRLTVACLQISSPSDPKNPRRTHYPKKSLSVPEEIIKSENGHFMERTNRGNERKCAVM
ncbi:hypothetical protein ILUMI_17438 [Ignelater luminosus]|uniref:PiggyBac transposable element-derived protein domain-containing protein n=1 Tax=Ignelater luminosus TaxID=2038154 RepID=A0A8K0G1W0_IGNLU|nr:hypothetical protein ILUMI_17438 [Ignelater luminosus]